MVDFHCATVSLDGSYKSFFAHGMDSHVRFGAANQVKVSLDCISLVWHRRSFVALVQNWFSPRGCLPISCRGQTCNDGADFGNAQSSNFLVLENSRRRSKTLVKNSKKHIRPFNKFKNVARGQRQTFCFVSVDPQRHLENVENCRSVVLDG